MTQQLRQGDVLLVPCHGVNAVRGKKVVASQDGRVILAYGEATGHHHSLSAKAATLFEREDKRYLRVTQPTMLEHQEHEHILVPRGTYLVIRQREYSPETIRNVQD